MPDENMGMGLLKMILDFTANPQSDIKSAAKHCTSFYM